MSTSISSCNSLSFLERSTEGLYSWLKSKSAKLAASRRQSGKSPYESVCWRIVASLCAEGGTRERFLKAARAEARKGEARGEERRGEARRGEARRGERREARRGERRGERREEARREARRGVARGEKRRGERRGEARRGEQDEGGAEAMRVRGHVESLAVLHPIL